jgi:hypothetical protein
MLQAGKACKPSRSHVAPREITALVNKAGLNHSPAPGAFGIAGAGMIAKAAFPPARLVDETP